MKIFLILLGLVISAFSVTIIYDARNIATNIFSSNETNETTKTLKVLGFVTLIIGLLIIYFIL